jgi:hypothetical protein
MAFSDIDFVKLNLPGGTSFEQNGVSLSLDDAIANALAEAGSRAGALAMLFRMLENDQFKSETIGKYSYERWNMAGSEYWALQAAAGSPAGGAPSVILRPSTLGGCW